MLVAYAAGLRISETVALQIADIKPDKQLLHIRSAKGGTERMVPLPRGVLQYLRSYWRNICPRPVTWLFYASSPDARIKEATLTFAFNKARERAGIDRSHTFHCLRHSAATHLHERGGSIDVIQDVLGHRNADSHTALRPGPPARCSRTLGPSNLKASLCFAPEPPCSASSPAWRTSSATPVLLTVSASPGVSIAHDSRSCPPSSPVAPSSSAVTSTAATPASASIRCTTHAAIATVRPAKASPARRWLHARAADILPVP